jgi:hypothetical protein
VSLTEQKKIVYGVSVWDYSCDAIDEGDPMGVTLFSFLGDEVAAWLTKYLNSDDSYRLIRRQDNHERDFPEQVLFLPDT